VDVTIAYDGVFEYSDRLLKQFKQPHTQETPPMIQLITMDTSEARARSRLHKCTHYNDHFVSLRPTDVELFYMPTRTSWCAHFIDWNEYVAEDIVRWLVSGEMDYRVQFPPDNAPLNEIYKAELQERTRRIQDKFKFPKGRDARNNVEGHLRPSLMHTLSPKKQQLIRKQMEQTVSIDCFRRSRKEEAKERTRLERESWEKPKSSGITASQLEKDTINQPSASALLVQNRVL
jgi:hypothetical protein